MKPPDLDGADFNRLVASVGAVLIFIGLLIPWFVYRDISVLSISREVLSGATEVGRETLNDRQIQAQRFQTWWPLASFILLVVGGAFVAWAMFRVSKLQALRDRLLAAEVQQAEAKVSDLTEDEIQEKAESDLSANWLEWEKAIEKVVGGGKVEHDEESRTAANNDSRSSDRENENQRPDDQPAAENEQTPDFEVGATKAEVLEETELAELIRDLVAGTDRLESNLQYSRTRFSGLGTGSAVAIENKVLERVQALLPAHLALSMHAKIESNNRVAKLDGLVTDTSTGFASTAIEVRVVVSPKSLQNSVDQAYAQAYRFRQIVGPMGRAWVVLVIPDISGRGDLTAGEAEAIAVGMETTFAKQRDSMPDVMLIRESEIDALVLPRYVMEV